MKSRTSFSAIPSAPRSSPLAISSNNHESVDSPICYSANEFDLRSRSNQLARLALRVESASIRSSTLSDHSSILEEDFDENDEDDTDDLIMESDQNDNLNGGDGHQDQSSYSLLANDLHDSSANRQVHIPSALSQNLPASSHSRVTNTDERGSIYFGHQYSTSTNSTGPINYGTLPTPIADPYTKQAYPILKPLRRVIGALPAVILGLMMNVLDGVSYGLIMFPSGAGLTTFNGFGGIGISMFFMTCIISQLVYSLGGSGFHGGNGSMMIESVPFMHVIAKKIIHGIGSEYPERIISTTMVSFAMSSVLTGFAFLALGALKLGNLMGFFPRHILVGCIGSVGAFLLLTGFSVTAHLDDGSLLTLSVIHHLLQSHIIPLWSVPLGLAIILRVLTSFFSHPFLVPAYFLIIPFGFYAVTSTAGLSLATLRSTGWVFDIDLPANTSPFAFYTLFKFNAIDWNILKTTVTAQLAMVIFGLLHVPLNVPALALSLRKDDVDINKELIAHGISNTLAGLAGTVSNYLCYVNSVLFARVGGDSRLAGVMLAVVMMGVFGAGPAAITYLPICVVGALIYLLGIDLLKEALWDTWGKVTWVEYGTIWAIVIAATWHDFVVGLVVGGILACMSFVATSSQHKAIRSVMDGCTARSTVRRHPTQQTFLKQVGMQTRVLKLQGHLFFGTISTCEEVIKSLLQRADGQPIQFLIVDFSSTVSIDFSAVEAFLRIHRLLLSKSIVFVICGTGNQVAQALRSVGLWNGDKIEVFEHLNQALEHCENVYLRNLYFPGEADPRKALARSQHSVTPAHVSNNQEVPFATRNSRRSFKSMTTNVLPSSRSPPSSSGPSMEVASDPTIAFQIPQPLPLLLQTFRPFLPEQNELFWLQIAPYFRRAEFKQKMIVWQIGAKADCFYLIQSGILRATYAWPTLLPTANDDSTPNESTGKSNQIEESMLPGTVAGDHSFLAQLHRNTRVVAETDAVLWKMEFESWRNLDINLREIVAIGLLKMAAMEEEVLVGHLFTRF